MWKGIKKGFGTVVGVYLGLGAIYCFNGVLNTVIKQDKEESSKEESVEENKEGEAQ